MKAGNVFPSSGTDLNSGVNITIIAETSILQSHYNMD